MVSLQSPERRDITIDVLHCTIPDSDIISINQFGRTIIILNSAQAIGDLLEKRSAIYSDRVRHPMLNEL